MEAYEGPQIVGMDLHRRRSVLVRMTEDGQNTAPPRIVLVEDGIIIGAELSPAPAPDGCRVTYLPGHCPAGP